MVDAIQNDCGLVETAPRPIRKKFAKPPVKVACLPWCVFNAAPIANRRWPGGGFVFVELVARTDPAVDWSTN
jgi:hypothetical protein